MFRCLGILKAVRARQSSSSCVAIAKSLFLLDLRKCFIRLGLNDQPISCVFTEQCLFSNPILLNFFGIFSQDSIEDKNECSSHTSFDITNVGRLAPKSINPQSVSRQSKVD